MVNETEIKEIIEKVTEDSMKEFLLKDINSLKEKLLIKATEKVKLGNADTMDIAKRDHGAKVRTMKNHLKEKLSVWNTILEAELTINVWQKTLKLTKD